MLVCRDCARPREGSQERCPDCGCDEWRTPPPTGQFLVIIGAFACCAAGFYLGVKLPVWLEPPGGPSEPAMLVGGLVYGPVGALLGLVGGAFGFTRLLRRSQSRGPG
jgi:RNA polymerase subunit RPABC4/transcription elongation factor Spt4